MQPPPDPPSTFPTAAVITAAVTLVGIVIGVYATVRKKQYDERTKQTEAFDKMMAAAHLYVNDVMDLSEESYSAWQNTETRAEDDDTDYEMIKRLTDQLPTRDEEFVRAVSTFATLVPPELRDPEFNHFQAKITGLSRLLRKEKLLHQWAPIYLYPKLGRFQDNQTRILREYDHLPPQTWIRWAKERSKAAALRIKSRFKPLPPPPPTKLPIPMADAKGQAEGDRLLAALERTE